MNFTIKPYSDHLLQDWNRFLYQSKNGVFLFDRRYMEYHKERFEDASALIYNGDKIVALFPASKKNNEISSHQGLTYGGLIYGKDFKAVDAMDVLSLLCAYYKEDGNEILIYKSIPYIFHAYPAQEDLYALFRMNAHLYRRDLFSVVPIKNPISFSETKRQLVRKCEKQKVEVAETHECSSFWNLLTEVLRRHDATPVHTLNEIVYLKNKFPEQIRLFVALDQTELLAGVLVYDYGNVVHTQYMANSQKGRKLGALDYINFKLITDFFKDREYYSFGSSNEDNGKILNEGLSMQKENMGGRGIAHDFYKIDLK